MRKEVITCDECKKETNEFEGYYDIIPNFACSKPGCLVLHIWPKPQTICRDCYGKKEN